MIPMKSLGFSSSIVVRTIPNLGIYCDDWWNNTVSFVIEAYTAANYRSMKG
jgi:hypothetical protein